MKQLFKVLKWGGGLVLGLALIVSALVIYSGHLIEERRQIVYNLPDINIAPEMKSADVKLGERIANIRNGCVDCHGANFAGKTFINEAPVGVVTGKNLTPYNLGTWTDEQIARALRYGVNRDNKALLIMPSHEYQNLSRSDTAALIAYLRTLPSVNEPNPVITLGPVSKILYLIGKLPTLMPVEMVEKTGRFTEKPNELADANFGKYLVSASCTGCHGPNLAGGPIPGGPPSWAPAADLRPSAIGKWSEKEFIKAMKIGVNPSGKKLLEPFPLALTSQLSDVELKAIYSYLQIAPEETLADNH